MNVRVIKLETYHIYCGSPIKYCGVFTYLPWYPYWLCLSASIFEVFLFLISYSRPPQAMSQI